MVTFSQLQLDAWLAGFLLPFLRVLALFVAAPILGHRALPMRARVAAAAAVAVVVAPLLPATPGIALWSPTGMALAAQQVVIGLALGFCARLMFAVFEIAGEMIGLQMGLSFAGFFSPQGGSETAVGSWLHTVAMLLFISMDGHLLLLDTLIATFRSLPIAADPVAALRAVNAAQLGSDVFRLAVSLALPATLLILFVNLVLGFASRVAPQLSIFSVGMPITLLVGLAALALSVPHLQAVLPQAVGAFLAPWR